MTTEKTFHTEASLGFQLATREREKGGFTWALYSKEMSQQNDHTGLICSGTVTNGGWDEGGDRWHGGTIWVNAWSSLDERGTDPLDNYEQRGGNSHMTWLLRSMLRPMLMQACTEHGVYLDEDSHSWYRVLPPARREWGKQPELQAL